MGSQSLLRNKPKEPPYAPVEVALPTKKPTEEDLLYFEKTAKLKDHLRKKLIHATIFKTLDSNSEKSKKIAVFDPLETMTNDFNGEPIKVQPVTTFPKKLVIVPNVNIPPEPAQVLSDRLEIAKALGEQFNPTRHEGFFNTATGKTWTIQSSGEGAATANLTGGGNYQINALKSYFKQTLFSTDLASKQCGDTNGPTFKKAPT